MGVKEPGHQSFIPQFDEPGTGRYLNIVSSAHCLNRVPSNQDYGIIDRRSSGSIVEAGAVTAVI